MCGDESAPAIWNKICIRSITSHAVDTIGEGGVSRHSTRCGYLHKGIETASALVLFSIPVGSEGEE